LLTAGIAALLTFAVYHGVRMEQRRHLAQRAVAASALQSAGQSLSVEQKEDFKDWQTVMERTHPDRQALNKDIAEMRGGRTTAMG